MRVITWRGGAHFTTDDVPDLVPGPDEVVVQIEAVGVCGTDVHITQGLFPADAPQVLGHEGSGIITQTGPGIDPARIGQRVVMDTTSHCGVCDNCRTWSLSRCERLQKSTGFYAEYARLPAQCAHPIPASMSYEVAALTEPASCCLSGVESLDHVRGATALVVGGGIMGQLTAALLRRAGAARILVSEPFANRRDAARSMGADRLHDPGAGPLAEAVHEATNGRGVDIAVEAVGKPQLVADCVALTRPRGQVLMIGVCPQGTPLPIDLYDFHYREIRLLGAFGRGNVFARTPEVLMELDVAPVLSEHYALDDVPKAIDATAAGEGVKLFIAPQLSAAS